MARLDAKYYPDSDIEDAANVTGYNLAMTLVHLLQECGDDLSRESLMRQATRLDLDLPMLLPGVRVSISRTQFLPIHEMQLARFKGMYWERLGKVLASE